MSSGRSPSWGPRNKQRWVILALRAGPATALDSKYVIQSISATDNANQVAQFAALDSTAQAAGVGGVIAFGGKYTDAGDYTTWAAIQGVKENGTTGDFAASLAFLTRTAAGVYSKKLWLTSDGRLYGSALHNNAGSLSGPANQYIASGSKAGSYWVPTLTNTGNITSSTLGYATFIRVGNVVDARVRGTVLPAAIGACQLDITLPVGSTLTVAGELNGTGTYLHTSTPGAPGTVGLNAGYVQTDVANARASFTFQAPAVPAGEMRFDVHFQYEVL